VLILTVLSGPDRGRKFELPDNEPQLIGRSTEALLLTDQTISRRHAELTPDDGRWYINDLKSANGTFLNGQRVTKRTLLQPGDQIRVGNTLLVYGREQKAAPLVRMAGQGEIESHIERTVAASQDSMIMAVPDPTEAAAFNLNAIYQLLELIGSTVERKELLTKVMDLIFENFKADRGFILLQDRESGDLEPVVVRHKRAPSDREEKQIAISHTIVDYVVNRRQGVLSGNAMNDLRFSSGDSVQRYAIRSALCVPVIFKDELFGVIQLDSKVANYTYTDDQLHLLTAIGVQTGLALANMRLYEDRLARERLAAIGQTVASLSHAIKNIIQGLSGGAEVVDMGLRKESPKLVQSGWQVVKANVERISRLTLNMLAFSKPRNPELEMVNLNNVLAEAVELVQKRYDAKKVALLPALEEDMPPVPLDAAGIHQVVLNLLNNALEAVEENKGAVTLSSEYDPQAGRARVSVADNGVGIDPEIRKHLFQPFYSTKGQKGTGLGLAVTKKIVEEHGGVIRVESTVHQGTTFTIELPTTAAGLPSSSDTAGPALRADDEPEESADS